MENEEKIVPETKTGDEGKDPSQEIKIERTPEEIARYNLKKKADEAKALGLNPRDIVGGESGDEVPAWYKAEKAKEVKKTSLQLAESISDEDIREKVKDYIQNRLVPSGNAEEDFKLALAAASASKNKQIIEEVNRYTVPKITVSGGSQPAIQEDEFIPTEQEKIFMAKPYFMSKEKILAARKKIEK